MFFEYLCDPCEFKLRSKPIPRGSNSGCSGVNVALSITWSDLENQGHPPWKNRNCSAGRCNFGFQQHTDIILTGPPHFRPRPTSTRHWGHCFRLTDVGRRWQTTNIQDGRQQKPEVEITFERHVMAPRFQFCSIFSAMPDSDSDRLCYCRHWPTSPTLPDVDRLPKIKMAATKTGNGNKN